MEGIRQLYNNEQEYIDGRKWIKIGLVYFGLGSSGMLFILEQTAGTG